MNDEIINELYFNTDELMKNLFSKYLNGKEVFKDIEYKKIKNNIDLNIKFSNLKIVVITINAELPLDINYNNFVEYIKNNELFIINDKNKTEFYNCITFKININDNLLNVKYFKNGSLHITGCKNVENITELILLIISIICKNKDYFIEEIPSNYKIIKLLEKLKINELRKIGNKYNVSNYNKLKKQFIIDKIIKDTNYIQDNKIYHKYNKSNIDNFNIEDSKIRISMINSSYEIYDEIDSKKINFEIDRKKLFEYIKNNTDLSCYYDNTQHQGVKVNFMYNEYKTGECNCKKNCILLNKKNRTCKKITILIFNSGKIVITGSNSFEHTELCYNFINDLILKNYKEFVQMKF